MPSLHNIGIAPVEDRARHPILELPEVNYRRFPLITGPVRQVSVSTGGEMLLETSFRNTATTTPLLSVLERGNYRSAAVTAFNWYLPLQTENEGVRNFTESFFRNIVNWTATQPDTRRLKIRPVQRVFSGSERARLVAYLNNESGERETDAIIDIEMDGPSMDKRYYSMRHVANGEYRLDLGQLPDGLYRFDAEARKGNRTIDRQNGEFSVAETNTEFVDTERNEKLLYQIAAQTGGAYLPFSKANQLRDSLQKKGIFETRTQTIPLVWYLNRHFWWFIVAILLLTAEWVIRKYLALP
mgnify:CR=1 FL=1